MVHTPPPRFIRKVAPGSRAQITLILQNDHRGTFNAEIWDVRGPGDHSGALVPGVPLSLGPLSPPSVIYIDGDFHTNMDPNNDRIEIELDGQRRIIPLSGKKDDSVVVVAFVYPVMPV